MNDLLGINGINNIFFIMTTATIMILFWMLETVWSKDKKFIPLILLLPFTLLYFIYKYWEEMRFKCFFAGLLLVMIVFISGISGYNFTERLGALLQIISVWPYYTFILLH